MLGEFFLCSDDDLDPVLIEAGPDGRVACVTAGGLTPVNIAALGELLGVASYQDVLAECGNKHYESESGASGVWDAPASVARALSGSVNLDPIAEKWVATEELRRGGWRTADGLDVLSQLAELVSAQGQGQTLWYWWSL